MLRRAQRALNSETVKKQTYFPTHVVLILAVYLDALGILPFSLMQTTVLSRLPTKYN